MKSGKKIGIKIGVAMIMDVDFEPYRKFYNLLIDYIPSLCKLDKKPRYIMLNIDAIRKEAEKSNFNVKYGNVGYTDDYEFEEHCDDDEMIDIIFSGFSDVGDIFVLENSNVNSKPFECNFSNFKDELKKLPMAIFDIGDVVIIWKSKRIITVFHHTGYFAHIFCEI